MRGNIHTKTRNRLDDKKCLMLTTIKTNHDLLIHPLIKKRKANQVEEIAPPIEIIELDDDEDENDDFKRVNGSDEEEEDDFEELSDRYDEN